MTEEDRNRMVVWQCEIVLLDAKLPNGSLFQVIGRGESPEEARDKAADAADKFATTANRLRAT